MTHINILKFCLDIIKLKKKYLKNCLTYFNCVNISKTTVAVYIIGHGLLMQKKSKIIWNIYFDCLILHLSKTQTMLALPYENGLLGVPTSMYIEKFD